MRGEEREVRDRFRRRFDPNLLFARDRRAFAFGRIDRRPRGAPSGRGGTCAWEASRSVRTTGSRRRGCLRGGRSGRTRRRRRRGGEVAATRAPCTDDDASLHADADLRSRAQSASLRARSVRFLPPRRRHFRARHATRHALVARNGRRRAHPRGRASEHRGPHHLRASPARAPRPTAATTRVAPSSSAPQQQNEATNESRIRTSRRARLIDAPAAGHVAPRADARLPVAPSTLIRSKTSSRRCSPGSSRCRTASSRGSTRWATASTTWRGPWASSSRRRTTRERRTPRQTRREATPSRRSGDGERAIGSCIEAAAGGSLASFEASLNT